MSELSRDAAVYVSTERGIPADLDAQQIPVPPALMHDLLSEASLFVTDSNTMATEAGLLGTPTVRSGAYAETNEFSNFDVLFEAGLVESIAEEDRAVDRALELFEDPDAGRRWRQRRDAYVADKPDLTEYIVETVLAVAGGGPPERDASGSRQNPGGDRTVQAVSRGEGDD